jgi:signal transduction histidine kinase
VSKRVVKLPTKGFNKQGFDKSIPQEQESIYISEPKKIDEITANQSSGVIPRFGSDSLPLLFWKKQADGTIIGCSIDEGELRRRLAATIPELYSPVRILTILDQNGRPIITPGENKARDWRKPFVALEISSFLPRWEVAAYLTDPNMVRSQVMTVTTLLWALVFVMFVSILGGGTMVLRSLYGEINLAQQKTTFAANVSHELKTPLTSIRMFAEMLKEKRQPDETKQQKYFDIMVSETERLTRLINNVLDFSRKDQGKKHYNMATLDLVSLCRQIFENQRVRLEENGFKTNFTAPSSTLLVCADEEAIKQVMINIITNAEKYSADRKEIEIAVFSNLGFVCVDIKDRGIGISSSDAKKIFEPFYRVDDRLTAKTRGTGLGLTIAKQIIEDHQGSIFYFSHAGGGSIFEIRLPVMNYSGLRPGVS